MTIAPTELTLKNEPAPPLTYEAYLAEPPTNLRYDILEGVRFVTNPTRRHQRITFHIARAMQRYESTHQNGLTVIAACDVLIRRAPLRIRQPDVLYMSNACLAQNPPLDDPAPLNPAPELVVEIVSPANTPAELAARMADYHSVNVQECWLVYPDTQTVQVYTAAQTGWVLAATYTSGQTVQSLVFAGLSMAVDDVFAV